MKMARPAEQSDDVHPFERDRLDAKAMDTHVPLSTQTGRAGKPAKSGRKSLLTADEKRRRRRIRDRLRKGYSIEEAQDDRRKKSGPKGPRLSFEERQRRKKEYRRASRERAKLDPQKREANRAYMRRYWRKSRGLPPDCVVKIGRPCKIQPHQLGDIVDAYRQLRSWKRVAEQFAVCADTLRSFTSALDKSATVPAGPPHTCNHAQNDSAVVARPDTTGAMTRVRDRVGGKSQSTSETRRGLRDSWGNSMMNAEELMRLDTLLNAMRKPLSSVEMLDGFLVALQLCPKPSFDLELIRLLLGKRSRLDHPLLRSPKDAIEFLELTLRHRSNIRAALSQNNVYLTVLHQLPPRNSATKAWCTGFAKALQEDQEHWRPHLRNKRVARWIAPIYQIGDGKISLCPELHKMPPRRPGEEPEHLQIILCLNRLRLELHESSAQPVGDDAEDSTETTNGHLSLGPTLLTPPEKLSRRHLSRRPV